MTISYYPDTCCYANSTRRKSGMIDTLQQDRIVRPLRLTGLTVNTGTHAAVTTA